MDFRRKKGTGKPAGTSEGTSRPKPGAKPPSDEAAMDSAATTKHDVRSAAVDGSPTTTYTPGQAASLAGAAAAGEPAAVEPAEPAKPPRFPPLPARPKGDKVVALPVAARAGAKAGAEPAQTAEPDDDLAGLFGEDEAAPVASAPPPAPVPAPAAVPKQEAAAPANLEDTVRRMLQELLEPVTKRLEALERLLNPKLLENIDANGALDDAQKNELKRTKAKLENAGGVVGFLNANDASIEAMITTLEGSDKDDPATFDEDGRPVVGLVDQVEGHGATLDRYFGKDRGRLPVLLDDHTRPVTMNLVWALASKPESHSAETGKEIIDTVTRVASDRGPADVKAELSTLVANRDKIVEVLAGDRDLTVKQLEDPANAAVKKEVDDLVATVVLRAKYCLKTVKWDTLEAEAAAKREPPQQENAGGDE